MPLHGGFLVHLRFASNQFYFGRGEFRIGENSSCYLSQQSYFYDCYNCLAQSGPSIFIDIPTAFLAKCFETTVKNSGLDMKWHGGAFAWPGAGLGVPGKIRESRKITKGK